jgi:hypothetical protein
MDEAALNYNPEANTELDGSCVDVVLGCMNQLAFNYNPNANVDDESCIPLLYGCIDPAAFNYCDTCNTDNGSCIEYYYGCTDSTAINYNDNANSDNGSCIYPLSGCTDATAINYNVEANISDSSCYYSAGCSVGDVYYIPNECFSWVIQVDPYCCNSTWDDGCDGLYEYCVDGWTGPVSVETYNRLGINPYPNPTKNTVNFNNFVDVDVYDAKGILVNRHKNINVLDLPKGMYHLLIRFDELIFNKTIVKL